MSEKRAYRKSARAEKEAETRLSIVVAAMQLHEEIGPRATTISAIAARAGVQRLTVYRHFPDESAVFQACTGHWLSLNPPPDPAAWPRGDALARCRAALQAFDDYYGRTRAMWAGAHRDMAATPALQGPMAAFGAMLDNIAADLAAGLEAGPAARLTLRLCLGFPHWQELAAKEASAEARVAFALAWLDGALRAG